MNFLAHTYLSFNDPEILTGNLISDFVKGRKKYDYPPGILRGIDLHRSIDEFTDEHEINKELKKVFRPAYGLYSAAFLDVVYDHFLALDLAEQGLEEFEEFTEKSYTDIARFEPMLPDTFRNIFPHMRRNNWLYNYQFSFGIKNSFEGLVLRARYMSESAPAYKVFKDNYENLKLGFGEFFPQLRRYSLEKFSDIH